MKSKRLFLIGGGLALILASALAQFLPEELAERPKWEEWLQKAKVVASVHMGGSTAVTEPWKLTLSEGGITHFGLWKNPEGRLHGYLESWKTEIAGYRMDKLLGLNMVPPTVERRFQGNRGSVQFWVENRFSLEGMHQAKVEPPESVTPLWNRAVYLQRAFDNLISNEDRHARNVLITNDWRMILIDHSRTFRTSKEFTEKLLYTAHNKEGDRSMKELPRPFVEKIKELTFESIKAAVAEYLTDDQIKAMLKRRDLIMKDIDDLIQKNGEANVLY